MHAWWMSRSQLRKNDGKQAKTHGFGEKNAPFLNMIVCIPWGDTSKQRNYRNTGISGSRVVVPGLRQSEVAISGG